MKIPKAKPYWVIESKRVRNDSGSFHHSNEWRKLRNLKINQSPLCESCKENGIIKEGKEVHHDKPVHKYPELALTLSNLQTLCRECHVIKTTQEKRNAGKN